jgi:pimeloyl-ACP methyl ester carboxylesterase
MTRILALSLDWLAIQLASLRLPLPPVDGFEEAVRLLGSTEFIPTESPLARIDFQAQDWGLAFRFPTPRPCAFPENNMVYGRFYRCDDHWESRPAIVLLHGGYDVLNHCFRFPSIARVCCREKISAVTLELPYHFRRRPRQLIGVADLDYVQLAEAFAQGVAEIRALIGWLVENGCPAVGLWGFSWGAWLAGLAACHDPRLTALVLAMPVARMSTSSAESVIVPHVRRAMRKFQKPWEQLNLTPMNLVTSRPKLSKHNILLVEALYDLCVGSQHAEDLWKSWGEPEIWRLRHGHASAMVSPGLPGQVIRWLVPRLSSRTQALI